MIDGLTGRQTGLLPRGPKNIKIGLIGLINGTHTKKGI